MSKNEELYNAVDSGGSFCYTHVTFRSTYSISQDAPYSEKYMQQHDGGDRAEYLQEMENTDPWIYVPPVKDASLSAMDNNVPIN